MAGSYKHEWYVANRKRILAKRKEYASANKAKIAVRNKTYWQKTKNLKRDAKREQSLLRKFGINLAQYDEMLQRQNGVCAICLNPPKKRNLAVDHDHRSGKIRGLLCYRCNYGLGWLGDNWEKIQRVYKYFQEAYE